MCACKMTKGYCWVKTCKSVDELTTQKIPKGYELSQYRKHMPASQNPFRNNNLKSSCA